MPSVRKLLALPLAAGLIASVCHGAAAVELIHETSTGNYSGPGSYGTSVGGSTMLGTRFSVDEPTRITAIGGMFSDQGKNIYGAIIAMPGPVPQGPRLDGSDVLLATPFLTSAPGDTVVPVSVILPAGHYGLVFGSGEYGTSEGTAMPSSGGSNTAEGKDNYFWWGDSNSAWYDNEPNYTRFLVYGEPVPEPTSLALLGLGGLLVARRSR